MDMSCSARDASRALFLHLCKYSRIPEKELPSPIDRASYVRALARLRATAQPDAPPEPRFPHVEMWWQRVVGHAPDPKDVPATQALFASVLVDNEDLFALLLSFLNVSSVASLMGVCRWRVETCRKLQERLPRLHIFESTGRLPHGTDKNGEPWLANDKRVDLLVAVVEPVGPDEPPESCVLSTIEPNDEFNSFIDPTYGERFGHMHEDMDGDASTRRASLPSSSFLRYRGVGRPWTVAPDAASWRVVDPKKYGIRQPLIRVDLVDVETDEVVEKGLLPVVGRFGTSKTKPEGWCCSKSVYSTRNRSNPVHLYEVVTRAQFRLNRVFSSKCHGHRFALRVRGTAQKVDRNAPRKPLIKGSFVTMHALSRPFRLKSRASPNPRYAPGR